MVDFRDARCGLYIVNNRSKRMSGLSGTGARQDCFKVVTWCLFGLTFGSMWAPFGHILVICGCSESTLKKTSQNRGPTTTGWGGAPQGLLAKAKSPEQGHWDWEPGLVAPYLTRLWPEARRIYTQNAENPSKSDNLEFQKHPKHPFPIFPRAPHVCML